MTVAERSPAATYSRTCSRHNTSRVTRRSALGSLVVVVALLVSMVVSVAPAGAVMNRTESLLATEMFAQLNAERAARGLPALTLDVSMNSATRSLSERLEGEGYLFHSNDGRAEIVGYGWNTGQITDAFMRSAGHRHLITDPNLVPASMSISCDPSDGRMWVAVQFRRLDTSLATQSSSPASPVATPSSAGSSCASPPADVSDETVNAIKRLYRAYYLRDADWSGLDYWRNQAASGMTVWEISGHFESAIEFDERYGDLSNREFIDLVYLNVMGRNADSSGERYWVGQMRDGLTRGELMTYFSDSPEYRNRTGLN